MKAYAIVPLLIAVLAVIWTWLSPAKADIRPDQQTALIQIAVTVDSNHDGIISRGEYAAATNRAFDILDGNKNGQIDPAEYPVPADQMRQLLSDQLPGINKAVRSTPRPASRPPVTRSVHRTTGR